MANMDFEKLAAIFEELEKTASGNKMREILAEFLKTVPAQDIALVCYLLLGQIGSDYEGVVLGMADKLVLKSIAIAGGVEVSKVHKIMQETGDVGLAAERVLQRKPQTLVPVGRLTISELFEKLHKIAAISGTGSQETKSNILVALLQKTNQKGAKYVARLCLGTLRLGAADMTLLDALALAYTGDKKNKEQLEHAYNICPDVGLIAETLVQKGLKGIEKIDVHVGRPIKMMLCQRVDELEEIEDKIPGKKAVEAKYDGERVQVHKDTKGKITLFSRRLENITAQFPDLVEELDKQVQAKEFVIEGEIIAIDHQGNHLPFQTLMQRRRKHDIEQYMKDIPVQIKLFDLLFLNNKSFLSESYEQRSSQLAKIVKKSKHITLAEKIETEVVDEIDGFFQEMLKEKYEGIIVKSLSGEYQAGTRGWNWIKWKKEYVSEMQDTLDLVIVGAYYGKGKRHGVYGALLCAAYNEKDDTFETLCKLGTGLTDEVLAELPAKLAKYRLDHRPARLKINSGMEPEIWFEPKMVVEVFGAEITKSPFHTCGSGLALRFPRFVRFRDDKKAEQATTSKEIRQLAGN